MLLMEWWAVIGTTTTLSWTHGHCCWLFTCVYCFFGATFSTDFSKGVCVEPIEKDRNPDGRVRNGKGKLPLPTIPLPCRWSVLTVVFCGFAQKYTHDGNGGLMMTSLFPRATRFALHVSLPKNSYSHCRRILNVEF